MTNGPVDFIEYAKLQVGHDDPSELQLRNAGNRAYYALYHKARIKIHLMGVRLVSVQNAGSHESVIETIRQMGLKGKVIASEMHKLKKFRGTCDYDLSTDVPHLRAKKHVAESIRLMDMLDRL